MYSRVVLQKAGHASYCTAGGAYTRSTRAPGAAGARRRVSHQGKKKVGIGRQSVAQKSDAKKEQTKGRADAPLKETLASK